MDVFKWGPAFFSVNEIYFERYLECQTSDQLNTAQQDMIALVKQMKIDNKNREIDLPPNSSDEEESEDEENDEYEERKSEDNRDEIDSEKK